MKILKTFKVNDYQEDIRKPQYVKMPKGTQIIGYRDVTGESLIFCLIEDSEKKDEIRILKWISY